MASPVNSENLIIPASSTDVCAALLAMLQSIAVYRSDLDYRVDPDDGMPTQEFLDDLALRIPQLYGDATFDANAYNLTVTQVFTTNQDLKGRLVGIKLADPNTGPATLQINELTPAPILQNGSVPLAGGEMVAGKVAILIFDGSSFHLLNPEIPTAQSQIKTTGLVPVPITKTIAPVSRPAGAVLVRMVLVCTTAENGAGDTGYAVDEELEIASVFRDVGSSSHIPGFSVTTKEAAWIVAATDDAGAGDPTLRSAKTADGETGYHDLLPANWRLKAYYI